MRTLIFVLTVLAALNSFSDTVVIKGNQGEITIDCPQKETIDSIERAVNDDFARNHEPFDAIVDADVLIVRRVSGLWFNEPCIKLPSSLKCTLSYPGRVN